MNVQIGDIVLVFDVYGTASAAIVTSIGDNLTIGCASFMHDGTLRPIKQLLHISAVMQGFPCNFWDFRPSQKVTPPVAKLELEKTRTSSFENWYSKRFQTDSVEIKPRPYFENKPALGTFEWALVALKNGHKVRRFGWSNSAFLRYDGESLFNSNKLLAILGYDLLATDWVLA